MSTIIRPEISKKKPYHISKHRFYELKHFCMQYPEWKSEYDRLSIFAVGRPIGDLSGVKGVSGGDFVGERASRLADLSRKMELVRSVAVKSDDEIGWYIFMAVTEGLGFPVLKARYEVPCEKDMYYDRYRKFFFLLSGVRD